MELIILVVMLAVFAAGVFWWKLPSGVAMGAAAVAGALTGGHGVPVRHLVEGTFGYFDAMLIIASAMVFMKVVEATGALGTISAGMVRSLHRFPTLLMVVMAFFVMFPGMLTGLSSACILTTGALVAPALTAMGIPAVTAGAFIAMMAVFGMIAPPINIPVMIIGGGVDMPYVGFEGPLMLLTFPLAVFTAVYIRLRYVRSIDRDQVLSKLAPSLYHRHGALLFLPLALVIGAMAGVRLFPELVPDVGIPLVFMAGAAAGLGTGERVHVPTVLRTAVRDSMPVLGILAGVGMFVQVMTLTGVRGYLAVSALQLPPEVLYPGIALIMPAMGSAYAASSVVGVPLVFVFLGRNEVVVTSALSLIAGIGDLMPPPSLLCVFASQLLGIDNHFKVLRAAAVPIAVSLLAGVLMIVFAADIGQLFN